MLSLRRDIRQEREETRFCFLQSQNGTIAPVQVAMLSYTVTVSTGSQWFAGTDDYIYITLVGTEQCSERTLLDKPLYNDFERGAVSGTEAAAAADSLRQLWLKRKRWPHSLLRCKLSSHCSDFSLGCREVAAN